MEAECAICWESFRPEETVRCPNGHAVCAECRRRMYTDQCPSCRVGLPLLPAGPEPEIALRQFARNRLCSMLCCALFYYPIVVMAVVAMWAQALTTDRLGSHAGLWVLTAGVGVAGVWMWAKIGWEILIALAAPAVPVAPADPGP